LRNRKGDYNRQLGAVDYKSTNTISLIFHFHSHILGSTTTTNAVHSYYQEQAQ